MCSEKTRELEQSHQCIPLLASMINGTGSRCDRSLGLVGGNHQSLQQESAERYHVAAMQQAGGIASIKQVQVRTSGTQGGFLSLTNKWGSDWETPNAPAFPLDINIIGADGEAVGCPVLSPLLSSVLCTERLGSRGRCVD